MKSFTVIFSPVAIDDAEHTVDYYEKQQPRLGKRFATQLQLTLKAVYRNPFFASGVLPLKNSPIWCIITLMKMNYWLLLSPFTPLTKSHSGKIKAPAFLPTALILLSPSPAVVVV